jgi:hypothetical protein
MMQAVRKIIVRRSEQTREDMLGKEDMENVSADSSLASGFGILQF